MMSASQARRRTAVADRSSSPTVRPHPRTPAVKGSRGTVTTSCAFAVFGAAPGDETPRLMTMSRASARRAAGVRRSG